MKINANTARLLWNTKTDELLSIVQQAETTAQATYNADGNVSGAYTDAALMDGLTDTATATMLLYVYACNMLGMDTTSFQPEQRAFTADTLQTAIAYCSNLLTTAYSVTEKDMTAHMDEAGFEQVRDQVRSVLEHLGSEAAPFFFPDGTGTSWDAATANQLKLTGGGDWSSLSTGDTVVFATATTPEFPINQELEVISASANELVVAHDIDELHEEEVTTGEIPGVIVRRLSWA